MIMTQIEWFLILICVLFFLACGTVFANYLSHYDTGELEDEEVERFLQVLDKISGSNFLYLAVVYIFSIPIGLYLFFGVLFDPTDHSDEG